MSDQAQSNHESNHWDELARQLGLEPGEPVATPPAKEAKPVQASRPAEFREKEAREVDSSDEFERESVAEPEVERGEDKAPMGEEASPAADQSPVEEPPAQERARRGRRGGGRGRRTRDAAETQESSGRSAADEAAPAEESAERKERGRRGRRHGRRGAEAEEPEATPEVVEQAASDQGEDDIEEVDTLSDWSVPSWNELIASLYRPER
jgi:hypothetical protein